MHVSTMADDYYRFVERAHMLRGENNGQGLSARRSREACRSIKVDMERRQVDLGLVEILERRARSPRRTAGRAAARRSRGRSAASRSAPSANAKGKQRPGKKERAAPEAALTTVRSIVIGTAGHIDHGKSALVRALTGTDPDRLKEEQERGITIDLGFAHLQVGRARVRGQLAFVDVPGPRAVRQEHARRRRRHRPRDARRRGRRIGHAADARALSTSAGCCTSPGASSCSPRATSRDRETLELARLEVRELVAGIVSRRCARRRGVVAHGRRAGRL